MNKYSIESADLKILNLSEDKYSILDWLTLLVINRTFKKTTTVAMQAYKYLSNTFFIDTNKYDAIIGYRADDSYFAFAKGFLNNEITLSQLEMAMHLGHLVEQNVVRSEKAFDLLSSEGAETVRSEEFYIKRKIRDAKSKQAYLDLIKGGMDKDELVSEIENGIYMIDILRGEISADDECIQRNILR